MIPVCAKLKITYLLLYEVNRLFLIIEADKLRASNGILPQGALQASTLAVNLGYGGIFALPPAST